MNCGLLVVSSFNFWLNSVTFVPRKYESMKVYFTLGMMMFGAFVAAL